MQTPMATDPPRTATELIQLLTDQLDQAVRLAQNRSEHIRLVRMQGHLAELRDVTVGSP